MNNDNETKISKFHEFLSKNIEPNNIIKKILKYFLDILLEKNQNQINDNMNLLNEQLKKFQDLKNEIKNSIIFKDENEFKESIQNYLDSKNENNFLNEENDFYLICFFDEIKINNYSIIINLIKIYIGLEPVSLINNNKVIEKNINIFNNFKLVNKEIILNLIDFFLEFIYLKKKDYKDFFQYISNIYQLNEDFNEEIFHKIIIILKRIYVIKNKDLNIFLNKFYFSFFGNESIKIIFQYINEKIQEVSGKKIFSFLKKKNTEKQNFKNIIDDELIEKNIKMKNFRNENLKKSSNFSFHFIFKNNLKNKINFNHNFVLLNDNDIFKISLFFSFNNLEINLNGVKKNKKIKLDRILNIISIFFNSSTKTLDLYVNSSKNISEKINPFNELVNFDLFNKFTGELYFFCFNFFKSQNHIQNILEVHNKIDNMISEEYFISKEFLIDIYNNFLEYSIENNKNKQFDLDIITFIPIINIKRKVLYEDNYINEIINYNEGLIFLALFDCNIIFYNELLSNNNINLVEKGGFKVFIPIIKIILDEYKKNEKYINYFKDILEIFKELITDSKNYNLFKNEKIFDLICMLFEKYNIKLNDESINDLFKLPHSSKNNISNIFEYKTIINNIDILFIDEKISQLNFVLIEKIILILNSLSDENELFFNKKLKEIYFIFEEIYKLLKIDFKKIEDINLKDIFYICKKIYEKYNDKLDKNENIYNIIIFKFLLSNIILKIYYINNSIYNEIKNDEQNKLFISKIDVLFYEDFIIDNTIINFNKKINEKYYFENFINLFSEKYIYFYFYYIYCQVHNINSEKIKKLLINVMKFFLENSNKNFENFTFNDNTFISKNFMNRITKDNKNDFLLFLYQFFISFPGYPKNYSLLNFYYDYFNEKGKTINQNQTKEIENEKINEINEELKKIKIVNFPINNKKKYQEVQTYQLTFPIEEEFFIFLFLMIELYIHKFKNIFFQKRIINIALIKLKQLLFYYLYIFSFIENKYEEYYKNLSEENPNEKDYYEERKNLGIGYLKMKLKRYYTSIYCINKKSDINSDKYNFEDNNILKFEYLFSFYKENAITNNAINSLFNDEKDMKLFLIINNIKTKRYYKKIIKELFIYNGYYNIENIYQINNNLSLFKINNFITNDLKMPLLSPMIDLDYYLFENNNESIELNIKNILEKNITKFNFLFKINNNDNKILIDHINKILEKFILDFKIKIIDILKANCDLNLILTNKEKIIKILEENLFNDNLFNLLNDILNINNNINEQINNLHENIDIINNIIFKLKDNFLININLNELLLNNKYFNLFEILINNNNLSNYIYENYSITKIYECCLVKKTHHIKGFLFIYNKLDEIKIIFISFYFNLLRENCNNLNEDKCYGSFLYIPFKDELKKIKININDIDKIFEKNYFYSLTAFEIFTNYGKTYYFNFKNSNDKNEVLNQIISNNFKTYYINNEIVFYSKYNNPNTFAENEIEKKINYNFNEWENGLMTNYYLIMFLNIIGNRSFNDLFQYPVFPWISYYEENKKNYRELKFPLGRMNQEKKITKNNENEVKIKYYQKNDKYFYDFNIENDFCLELEEIIKDEDLYSFYFNNYMNPEAIKNYLLRIFPFYYINSAYFFIDENFDNLNDYFYNKTYSTYTSKELIPEFFYLSDLYINFNKISFKNQKKNDILLPANLNKFEVVIDFFKELESIKTSQNINYWIDLIFGYMQNTDDIIFEEKNIKNKYRPESYLNKKYNEKIYLECFIEGIVPKQLFFEKFLSRKIQSRKDFPLNTDSLNSNIFSFPNCFLENYMSYCYSIIIENNFGITINVFDERIYAIYLNNINENIIKDEIIYYPIDGEVTYKPIDANLLINYIKLNYQIIDINNNYIFMGGFKRGSIRYIIFKVTRDNTSEKNFIKKISYSDFLNLYNENKLNIIITAIISINYLDKFYLITGDNCGTIKFIKIIKESFKLNYEILKNIYEHSNEIFSIKYNNNLNLWLSAGLDNIINIFTFKKCEKIGTINLMNEKINKLNYVNFIVNPLISIIIIYDNVLISLSLNGEIIKKKIIAKNLNFQNPIIIENADFSQNILFLENNQNFVQFDLPFFEEIKNEIKFKNEIEKFNISLNNNLIIGIAKNKINNEKLIFNNNI